MAERAERSATALCHALDSLDQMASELFEIRCQSLILQEETHDILLQLLEMQQQLKQVEEKCIQEPIVTQKASNEPNGKTVAAGTIDQVDLE